MADPKHVLRCAVPDCNRKFTVGGSVYRHWRLNHPELTGGKTRDDSWAIPIDQGDENAVGGELQSPVSEQPVAAGPASVAEEVVVPVAVMAPLVFSPLQPHPQSQSQHPSSSLLPPLLSPSSYFPPSSLLSANFSPPLPRHPLSPQFLRISSPPSLQCRPTHQNQLRSSRSTRNQDHNVAPRNRAGGLDLDPTEGLPVQNWEFQTVRVNQDETTEPAESADQGPKFNHPNYPWPEQPLPAFFHQLPLLNQQLIQRARTGNTNPERSEWDRKNQKWIPGIEKEKAKARAKAEATTSNLGDQDGTENEDLDDEENVSGKRRKTDAGPQGRSFEYKKWTKVPQAIAEQRTETKYLADRRPGMPSLYGGAYKATNGFGSLGINPNAGSGAIGFEFGDANGLGNTSGVLGSAAAVPEPVPVRKNPPPRRKKKGGPGRKKKEPVPTPITTSTTQPLSAVATNTSTENQLQPVLPGAPTGDTQPQVEDAEGSGSDSDDDGSEEGEIAEEPELQTQPPRPVLEQITPEPFSPSAANEQIVEPTAPVLDAEVTVEEGLSKPLQQSPQPSNGLAEENMPVLITSELVVDAVLAEPAAPTSVQGSAAPSNAETAVQEPQSQIVQPSPETASNEADIATILDTDHPTTDQVIETLPNPTVQGAPAAEVEIIEASASDLIPEVTQVTQDVTANTESSNDVEMQDVAPAEAIAAQPDIPATAPEGDGEIDLLGGLEAAVDKEAGASAANDE
ncbi:hypothetical protein LTR84_001688 [Exophiala bonariae]|uniref:C2H2-type domain-containing protein n=1 Tax=Exophiala bonariae TaxID=1690606 RepID=A0AAV9NEQ5_9EURO|nr:hypothetical protein LTR84_001688 [Exophiala bonariae]